MLNNKQNIKQDWEETKSELGRVPKDGIPVIVIIADENHLEDGESSTGEIQQDVTNTPANCTLTPKSK